MPRPRSSWPRGQRCPKPLQLCPKLSPLCPSSCSQATPLGNPFNFLNAERSLFLWGDASHLCSRAPAPAPQPVCPWRKATSFPKHAGHGGQGRVAPRTKVQLGFLWLSPAVAEPKVPAVCVLCTRDRVCWRGAPAHSWMAGSDGSHPSRFVLWTWARNGHCGEDFNSSCLLQTRSPGRGWRRAGRSERAGTKPELGSD